MGQEEFLQVLKTIKSGTSFTAKVDQHGGFLDIIGKIHVEEKANVFYLCYDKGGDGDPSPDRHGYKYSWSIRNTNRSCIETIYFDTDIPSVSKEPEVINNYDIY